MRLALTRRAALLAVPSLAIFLTASLAARAQARVVVDTAQVAEAVARGAFVWDVRDPRSYRQGHVPGAVQVAEPERALRLPTSRETEEIRRVERNFAEAGLDPAREVVVYATRGSSIAYAAYAAVLYFGGKDVVVYHDGIEGWREGGRPLEAGDAKRPPVKVRLVIDPTVAIETDEMIRTVGRKDVQIVDARSPAEYAGLDVRAPRGGHVPGAVNIPYEENWADPLTMVKLMRGLAADTRGMALKSRDDLVRLYGALDPAAETIVYCQTGGRASETFGVLKELGFTRVRLYKHSWSVYATRLEAPIVSGSSPGAAPAAAPGAR